MSDRGMKKWAPYASLIEQKGTMNRMKINRTKTTKPLLSNEAVEAINRALFENVGKAIQITYFEEGLRKTIKTTLLAINIEQKCIQITEGSLPFSSLLSIGDY